MPETDRTLAIRAQAHIRAAGIPAPELPDILPLIPTALERLARMIAGDRARRHELRASFSLAVASGTASLSTLLAAPNRVLLEFLPGADVRDESGGSLYYLGRDRYEMDQPAPFGYFAYEGQTFLARLAGEEPGESDFTAAVTANYVPTADELPASCVADAVIVLASLAAPAPEKKERKK